MNKRELWDNFIKSGKVSDYLKYKNASGYDNENANEEFAEELFFDDPNLEDFNYDPQDRRYSDT